MICTIIEVSYSTEDSVTRLVVEHPDGTRHDYEIPGFTPYPRPGMKLTVEDLSPEEMPS